MTQKKGLRFNLGKTRHDLTPAFAQEQYAKVLTYGASKYTIGYINQWERIFVATNATKLSIIIADQCVGVVTKNGHGKISLLTPNVQNNIILNIENENEIWTTLEETIQKKEQETNEINGYMHLKSTILQKSNMSNCVKKVAQSVQVQDFCTLTMIILRDNLEESYVVNATTVLGSWETMWKVLKEQSHISETQLHFKYDGVRNWEKGMEWTKVLASLERHLQCIKNGEDIDHESQLFHSAHIMCNAAFLTEYYKIHPELDDRFHWFKKPLKRVYLDIDGVIADFEQHFLSYLNLDTHHPTDWNDFRFRKNFDKIADDDNFWLTIPRLIDPEQITYPIVGYCTSRPCNNEVTLQWLEVNGFPSGELINVGMDGNKSSILKDICDIFIDDSIKNFIDCQSNDITCYLMTRPHNVKYDVGHFRINSMSELIQRIRA